MRPIWSGTITFGLVTIPVKLYKATEEKRLDLTMLHKKDLSPIRYARICRADGKEIPYEDIVKGYEYQKGDYIVLTDEDFKKASPKKTQTIEITEFVNEKEVRPGYFEQPYYLEPAKGAEKAYALLRESMKQSHKVGIGKFVLRNRESLGVVMPSVDALIFNTIRFQREVRQPTDLKLPKDEQVKEREIEMALRLIEDMTTHFKPAKYKDDYEEELEKIVEKKVRGGKVKSKKVRPRRPTEVSHLMDALRSSLNKRSNRRHYA